MSDRHLEDHDPAQTSSREHVAYTDGDAMLSLPDIEPSLRASLASLRGWLVGPEVSAEEAAAFVMTPIFSVLLLVPLRARIGLATSFTAGILGTWIAHPLTRLDAPRATAAISDLVFASRPSARSWGETIVRTAGRNSATPPGDLGGARRSSAPSRTPRSTS